MTTRPSMFSSRIPATYVIVYATMIFFGLVENIKGVALPLIKTEFHVPYSEQGGLVSITWFGYVAFCLLASLFLSRFGIKRSIVAGYCLVCAGAIATLAAPSFWAVSLALVIVHTGFGFFEVGINAMATVVFTAKAALMMNLMHFFYGFGAILGPQLAGQLTEALDFTWRQVYFIALIPLGAFLLFILFTPFTFTKQRDVAAKPAGMSFAGALRNPIVWLFCVTLGFMEVIEFGAANWGGLYLNDMYGLDPRVIGARFVSVFYILFTLSRLCSGLLIERVGYMRSLQLATAGTMLLYLVGFGAGRHGIWLLPITGLTIAVMWPTIMAVAMQVFGSDAPVATSAIITISGAINGVFQLVIGVTNQTIGYAWGYRSCLLYALVALVTLRLLARRIRLKREAN